MGRRQRPIFFLLLFFGALALLRSDPFENKPAPIFSTTLMTPLTTEEKLLFGYRLDPNRMTLKDWELLPRIGPKLAERIIRFREEVGGFRNPEMLLQVPGVGEKTLQKLEPFIKEGVSTF